MTIRSRAQTAIEVASADQEDRHDDLQHRLRARDPELHADGQATAWNNGRPPARPGGAIEAGPITSYEAVKAIASEGNFYNKATPGDLDAIFAKIALDISQGSSRLVDDDF